MDQGLRRTLEGDIEIRVAGGDAFHEVFLVRPHHLSNVNPTLVQGCDLLDGSFGKEGSKIRWRYTLDGIAGLTQEQILEVIDEENKMIRFKVVGGNGLNDYKNFVITYKVIPKGEEKSLVKWIFEYEKTHPGVPEPSSLMDALIGLAKDIDDYHHSQAN